MFLFLFIFLIFLFHFCLFFVFFFFNDTATTEIYTLSLHDALPILRLHIRTPQSRRWPRANGTSACWHPSPSFRPASSRRSLMAPPQRISRSLASPSAGQRAR